MGSTRKRKAVKALVWNETVDAPVPSQPSFFRVDGFSYLCFVFGAFFFLHRNLTGVWACVLVEFAWRFLRVLDRGRPPGPEPRRTPPLDGSAIGALAAPGLLFALVLLSLPAYRWIFPGIPSFDGPTVQWLLGFLLFRMWFTSRLFPECARGSDFHPWTTRAILVLILLVSVLLRFHRLSEAPGPYWDDCAEDIVNARIIPELGQHCFVIPVGTHEPFFSYFTALFFLFLPDAPCILVHRLSLSVLGVLAVWIFYLLGKEAGGRRAGLILAGLAAVSKPLVMMSMIMLRFNTMTMWVAAALLIFLRLLKKPDLRHFIQWGVVTSVGVYTYPSYRPFVPFLILTALVWVLRDPKERLLGFNERVFLGFYLAVLGGFYVYCMNFLTYPNRVSRLLAETGFVLPALLLSALVPGLVIFHLEARLRGRHAKLSGWMAGSLICTILSAPILAHPLILARLSALNFLKGLSLAQAFQRVAGKSGELVGFLFFGRGVHDDCPVWFDAFFDFAGTAVIALGVVYALSRFRMDRWFLLLFAAVGWSSFVLSGDPHSGKVLAATIPLLLLGALALEHLWTTPGCLWPALRGGVASFLVLAGFLALSGWCTFQRVYVHWMRDYRDLNAVVARQAAADSSRYRVYLGNFGGYISTLGSMASLEILLEGKGARILWKDNRVDLGPGEAPKDLVVLLLANHFELKNAISTAYPAARFVTVGSPGGSGAIPAVLRAQIPWESVQSASGGGREPRFKVRTSEGAEWSRTFYCRFSLIRGLVWWEDYSRDLTPPVPPPSDIEIFTARYKLPIRIDKPGLSSIRTESLNGVVVRVDGKVVLRDLPRVSGTIREKLVGVRLEAGTHELEITVDYKSGPQPPDVKIRVPGGDRFQDPLELTTAATIGRR